MSSEQASRAPRWLRSLAPSRKARSSATSQSDSRPRRSATPTEFRPQKSRFLRLPPELRQLIYAYVFGNDAVHIHASEQHPRLEHTACQRTNPPGAEGDEFWRDFCMYEERCGGRIGIALLLVCKQMYAESISLLYSARIFKFQLEREPFRSLNDFCARVPAQRRAMVHSLDLLNFFSAKAPSHYASLDVVPSLAPLPNLRRLRTCLEAAHWDYWLDMARNGQKQVVPESIFRPLWDLVKEREMEITLAMPESFMDHFCNGLEGDEGTVEIHEQPDQYRRLRAWGCDITLVQSEVFAGLLDAS